VAVSRRSARPRFTLLVLILASLTLITLDVRGGGSIPGLRGKARDLFSPVQSATSSATHPVTDFFNGVFQYQSLKADNARLRAQIAELEAQQIENQYYQQTNKDLTDLLKLPFVGDIPFVAAPVIAGPESNFQLTIVIGRGSSSGILKGMPVVAGSGLVGRIVAVSASQSTVLLLTDASASVGVQFAPSPVVGVASGQGSDHELPVTLAQPDASVPVGTVAVTSGLEGSPYPRGIPVGKVVSSISQVGVQAHLVSIAPIVDLGRLSYVDVLVWTAQASANGAGGAVSPGTGANAGTNPAATTTTTSPGATTTTVPQRSAGG
jgi:rod shape-determining protein MreC